MQISIVVLCLAFASATALRACTTATDCRCPHFPPGMHAICSQQACHCHTGSTCKTAADCTTCRHGATVTCDEDAPGSAFCHCDGHEAPPQMQKCTTADTCHNCPDPSLNKICHSGECQCHFDNECESASDCYTCPPFAKNVTCESNNCHCDGHQAPLKPPTCNSVSDCPPCPLANMTLACFNKECHCHMPGECKVASDCTTCPPQAITVTCDGDGTGDMFCHCDGHPAPPPHNLAHGGPGGFHGFHGGN